MFYDLILSLLSGLLLFLSFPKIDLYLLAWFSFLPFLLSIYRNRGNILFCAALGYIFGVSFFSPSIYWIFGVLINYGGLNPFLSFILWFLLVSYLSLYFSLLSIFSSKIMEKGYSISPFIGPFFVTLEYVKGHFLSGFPWLLLGYSQINLLKISQICDIFGIYGLSFLVIFGNCAIYDFIKGKKVYLPIFMILFFASYLYGVSILKRGESSKKSESVGIVQGNFPQLEKWREDYALTITKIYENYTEELVKKGIRFIVWPESAVPFSDLENPLYILHLKRLTKRLSAKLLFGIIHEENDIYFNSAYLFSCGRFLGRYDKVHLVPFGEYSPLGKLISISSIGEKMGDLTPGKSLKVLKVDGEKIGIMICYEAIFPEIARSLKNLGATLIFNLTDDSWFGKTSAPYQHLLMARARAIENRVYIVRAANTGISAIIDPHGKICAYLPTFTRGLVADKIYFTKKATIYDKVGDSFVYILVLILVLEVVYVGRKGKAFKVV